MADPEFGTHALELWGGHECTVNRVQDRFTDQSVVSGHDARPGDLALFARLGIKALRYPLLWERISPDGEGIFDWRATDARLAELGASGVRPIAGLVHHGSGPHYTHLLDDRFAAKLSDFAGAVAARYPWIDDWTPVNEPLTTARFSALYGHWYPHARDERAFWQALLNQIDGIRLSMRAIRRINPAARLIQTEDLGRSWATVPLRHQAGFDNVRRWMSWDLLCGRVVPEHPMWDRLTGFGLGSRLAVIANDPCPPDLIGVNHYLTSDRFLDHRIRRYPAHAIGGNAEQRYADIEAVRVLDPAPPGLAGVLHEAWQRYGIPLAITEVHNGCSREEQMRWMGEAWRTAQKLRKEGVDIRAVTSWALLGSQGWNTLLTDRGHYEAGAFDTRSGTPQPTALASMLSDIDRPENQHPVAQGRGWWRRPIRLLYAPVPRTAPLTDTSPAPDWRANGDRPLMICGATGTLGQALARACAHRDIGHVLLDRSALDLTDGATIAAALDRHRPWAVINAAGWVRVDDAERDPQGCSAANLKGAVDLARHCDDREISTVSFSSDLVFDGAKQSPYLEGDPPAPLGVYGASKALADRLILELAGSHLVIRTAAFFSPLDAHNFAMQVATRLLAGERFAASDQHIVSPTFVPHLCDSVLDLLIDGASGLRHVAGGTALSWYDFAERIADRCGLPRGLLDRALAEDLGWVAERPRHAALATAHGTQMPSLDVALDQFRDHLLRASPREDVFTRVC
ncbi:family 1 glycosylhydrolase [Sphingomonas sp. AOB5]|uniref:family 1 glycosylhydrolase n=1 Tax=Sphingomonas sp. AOB5 TaxID=3034017 RepID=UPI0023F6A69F|nr:family 1 glycosylhydrolase [Sphingomonas sp. AOB5]MDF7773645.1 family 1 glycosylhydrolase [Sphingomonas sp. AOB5]